VVRAQLVKRYVLFSAKILICLFNDIDNKWSGCGLFESKCLLAKIKKILYLLTKRPLMTLTEDISRQVRAYVSKLTHDKEQADEVSQQVLLKMHEAIGSLKDEQKLGSWLKRIVYTTLMDYYRKQKKNLSLSFDEEKELTQEDTSQANLALIDCIQSLLQGLPDEQQQLLKAIEIQGISQAQYARDYHLPLSTVKSRVQRAKQKIREQITSNCFLQVDSYGNVIEYRLPKNN
jgi:RNA polymerase sigma-70 factor (ECF subfamily)